MVGVVGAVDSVDKVDNVFFTLSKRSVFIQASASLSTASNSLDNNVEKVKLVGWVMVWV